MIVNTPLHVKTLDYYEILFSNGVVLPVTIDKEGGDVVDFMENHAIRFDLKARPSQTDPDQSFPPEDVTIFTRHVASIKHWTAEVTEPTVEQREEMKRTLIELSKTVH